MTKPRLKPEVVDALEEHLEAMEALSPTEDRRIIAGLRFLLEMYKNDLPKVGINTQNINKLSEDKRESAMQEMADINQKTGQYD